MFFTVLRHLICFCVSGIFYLFNKPVYFCTICEIILSCHKVKTVSLRFLKTQHTEKKKTCMSRGLLARGHYYLCLFTCF